MALSAKRPSKGEELKNKILNEVREEGRKKRLNLDIEEGLYKKIKLKAIEEDRSISEITRALWVKYLD